MLELDGVAAPSPSSGSLSAGPFRHPPPPHVAPDDDAVEFEYPDVLQHGQINLLPNRDCIKPNGPYDANELTSKTLCGDTGDGISGVDACLGDSGMPIFYRNEDGSPVVVGIVSSGIG